MSVNVKTKIQKKKVFWSIYRATNKKIIFDLTSNA